MSATTIDLRLPPLYPKQRAAIYATERYAVVEASTKSGKTYGTIVWLLDQAVQRGAPGRNFWWVAPVYPQTLIAFRRLWRMLQRAQQESGAPVIFKKNESEHRIELPNGACICFKSSEIADNLYGEDVYAAVFDEATRASEEAWYALRSTLTATQGPVRIIGNVKGRKNWVYRLARKAQGGMADHAYARLTAWDAVEARILANEEIEDAKRTLPEHVFRQLYLAEAADDAGNPFGIEAIVRCTKALEPSLPAVKWWGVDLAKSVDWTVAIGLDAQGQVRGFQRWQSDWRNTIQRLRGMIKATPALVDETGVGNPIVEELRRHCNGVQGFTFTSTSKQALMEGLASAIQSEAIAFPPGEIVSELESFEYVYKGTKPSGDGFETHGFAGVRYSAPEGAYDDCVCALALAVQCRRTAARFSMATISGASDEGPMEYDWLEDPELWQEC